MRRRHLAQSPPSAQSPGSNVLPTPRLEVFGTLTYLTDLLQTGTQRTDDDATARRATLLGQAGTKTWAIAASARSGRSGSDTTFVKLGSSEHAWRKMDSEGDIPVARSDAHRKLISIAFFARRPPGHAFPTTFLDF